MFFISFLKNREREGGKVKGGVGESESEGKRDTNFLTWKSVPLFLVSLAKIV